MVITRKSLSERMRTTDRRDKADAVTDPPRDSLGLGSHPRLRRTHRQDRRPPFDCIALLLQGGGALGAYQAGVYEALAEAELPPDWVAGISIGSINAAIIVGNPPETRVDKLREFWRGVTSSPFALNGEFSSLFGKGDAAHRLANQISAAVAVMSGAPGFFTPRLPNPWLQAPGTLAATSYYDTGALKGTLERLIDFDRINAGPVRLSLGSTNARTGNLVYFDSTTHVIRPEHVMASGALPPGLPAVEIEGEYYWDGGLVSNTPLQWVATNWPGDTLAFQVDLWNARGAFPRTLADVATRQKDIQYSSRTRAFTDFVKTLNRVNNAVALLLDKLPDELKDSGEVRFLASLAHRHRVHNIVHLIYRAESWEGEFKDCEFSRQSMEERWRNGYQDTVHTLRHPEVLERSADELGGVRTFDFAGRD